MSFGACHDYSLAGCFYRHRVCFVFLALSSFDAFWSWNTFQTWNSMFNRRVSGFSLHSEIRGGSTKRKKNPGIKLVLPEVEGGKMTNSLNAYSCWFWRVLQNLVRTNKDHIQVLISKLSLVYASMKPTVWLSVAARCQWWYVCLIPDLTWQINFGITGCCGYVCALLLCVQYSLIKSVTHLFGFPTTVASIKPAWPLTV